VLHFLHTELSPKGTRVLCVLTQADMVDDAIARDAVNVQSSQVLHKMRQCVMRKAGLPLNQVIFLTAILLPHAYLELNE
jgi:hypothetical protein